MTAFELPRTQLGRGITLLEASAGTGKTYTLVGLVLRLLLEGHAPGLGSVLVVTFTIAATEELKSRLRSTLQLCRDACRGAHVDDAFLRQLGNQHGERGARILEQALREFDDLAVSTIHGFCKRLLEEQAFECGAPFQSEFAEDDVPPVHRAAVFVCRRRLRDGDTLLAAVCAAAGLGPERLVQDFVLWSRHPGARLLAEPAPLDEALADVRRTLAAAAAAASQPGLAAQLDELLFRNKEKRDKRPWLWRDAATFAGRIAALAVRDPALALPLLLDLDGSEFEEDLQKSSKPAAQRGVFLACTELAAAVRRAGHSLRTSLLREVGTEVERDKRRQNVLVFQDLLERVHRALHDEAHGKVLVRAVQDRFAAALIDEFQDTDRLQYDIFRTCFRNRPLFLVGDPKQSIYGFRGADVYAYLAAQAEATGRYTLSHNHRSHPDLVHAVQALFAASPRPFAERRIGLPRVEPAKTREECRIEGEQRPVLQWRFLPPDPRLHRSLWPKDLAEPVIVADLCREIVRLLSSGLHAGDDRLTERHLAVLTRTNAQAVAVQDGLRRCGVHSAIGKAGDIFDSDEMEEIDRLLRALLQPGNLRLCRAAWATRLWGRNAAAIVALDNEADLESERERLERWRTLWHRQGLVVMAEDLLANLGVRARILARADGERRLTNYLQVIELLHGAEVAHHLTPDGLLLWLQHERVHQKEIDYQRRELRLESDAAAVQILTVHGSKGLEYDVVFCPFLWDGRDVRQPPFQYHDDGRMVLYLGCADDEAALKARARDEQLAEDLRLLYVALTRARRRCYVWCGGMSTAGRSALAWLLHGPRTEEAADAGDIAGVLLWQRQLEEFAAQHPGLMEVALVEEGTVPGRTPAEAAPLPRQARKLPERLPPALAMLSFTGLALGTDDPEPSPEYADPPLADAAAPIPIAAGIAGFARGSRAGRCLHAILEHVDLGTVRRDPRDPEVAAVIRRELQRHGLEQPGAHPGAVDPAGAVAAMLVELATVQAPLLGLRFADLQPQRCQREWQFVLPVQDLQPRALAQAFAQNGQGQVAAYARRLQALSPRAISGFLMGFVDLVAEQDGRWFVLDWKSNHLGAEPADYRRDALSRCMSEHDYVLQYHLYTLALDLLLQQRLRGYDYERHFGGVCYVFLRGVRAGGDLGLFVDRPPHALIAALRRWTEGARP